MDINNLIERLMSLTYKNNNEPFEYNIINDRYKDKVSAEILKWYKTQDTTKEYEIIEVKKRIAELEAKVYTYEKIIANSNFAPILPKWVDYPITCNEKGATMNREYKLPEILYKLLAKHNMTQQQLADKLVCGQNTIYKWLRKDVMPNLCFVMRMAEIFNVSTDHLIYGTESR